MNVHGRPIFKGGLKQHAVAAVAKGEELLYVLCMYTMKGCGQSLRGRVGKLQEKSKTRSSARALRVLQTFSCVCAMDKTCRSKIGVYQT